MIQALETIFKENINIKVKGYYIVENFRKIYYDFQPLDNSTSLKGPYDILYTEELIYYIKEQNS